MNASAMRGSLIHAVPDSMNAQVLPATTPSVINTNPKPMELVIRLSSDPKRRKRLNSEQIDPSFLELAFLNQIEDAKPRP